MADTTTHDVMVAQTEAAAELLDYFQGQQAQMLANQAAFDAWRQDRDTLGVAAEPGARRVGVFQGKIVHTGGGTYAGDPEPTGDFLLPGAVLDAGASANVYLHLKTPLNVSVLPSAMFLFDLYGYAYGAREHISGKVAGYSYVTNQTLISVDASGTHGLTAYKGSDKFVYLRILLPSTYFLTLTVDTFRVGNGPLFPLQSLTPKFSTQATL